MSTQIQNILRGLGSDYVTAAQLDVLLSGTENARYAQVKRALAQGHLVRLKRGVYRRAGYLESAKPHPFEVAQYLVWPSYVSLESALSYHGLIPEIVYTCTCVTYKRPSKIKNDYGVFDFKKVPHRNFMVGVERVEDGPACYLVATPWKALCDYVYCYKKNWTSMAPLVESLRIEAVDLMSLSKSDKKKLSEYYHSSRVDNFLKGVASGH